MSFGLLRFFFLGVVFTFFFGVATTFAFAFPFAFTFAFGFAFSFGSIFFPHSGRSWEHLPLGSHPPWGCQRLIQQVQNPLPHLELTPGPHLPSWLPSPSHVLCPDHGWKQGASWARLLWVHFHALLHHACVEADHGVVPWERWR